MVLKKVIEMEKGKIGLDDYPIFDEDYRAELNNKIIAHYWNQEIGQETIDMWRFAMRRKMNEIMPLYNQHYRLSLLSVDPLSTMDVKTIVATDGETSTTGNSSNTGGSTAKARAIGSDFPQAILMDNGDYATTGNDTISDTTATGSATDNQNATQNATQTSSNTGYQGHAPVLILQARQALVNVDMMVINELRELFMLIWANNDSYTGSRYPYYGLY